MALDGRTILVTGATGDLGSVVCRRLSVSGAKVAGLVRSAPAGARFVPVVGALTDERSAETVVAAAESAAGPLWAVVNTVGGWAGGKPVAQSSLADLDGMLNVNLRTAFVLARAAVRAFGSRGGRIVNVASFTSATGMRNAGSAAYHAAKAALIALTRTLAEEGAPAGIGANCVAPGTMRMAKSAGFGDPARQVPVEDVAEAIAFLCDPAAGAVTGNVVLLPER